MKRTIIVIWLSLCLLAASQVSGLSFNDIKEKLNLGKSLANDLLGEDGEIPRGNGCNIKWSIRGTLRGLKWKWVGTCIDKCTGITEVHTKYSRDGALEHCLTALNKELLRKGEL